MWLVKTLHLCKMHDEVCRIGSVLPMRIKIKIFRPFLNISVGSLGQRKIFSGGFLDAHI